MGVEETIKEKVREQLHALKTIDAFYKEKGTDIAKNMEVIKVLKKKTKDLKHEDVTENLINIMVASYEQTLLNNQALNFHIHLFTELRAIALVNNVELDLSEEDKQFIENLNNASSLLYVIDKNKVVPKDSDVYNKLMERTREMSSTEENLKGCFEHIK